MNGRLGYITIFSISIGGYWVLSRRTFREITREKRRFMKEMRDRSFQIGGRMTSMTLVTRATFRGDCRSWRTLSSASPARPLQSCQESLSWVSEYNGKPTLTTLQWRVSQLDIFRSDRISSI